MAIHLNSKNQNPHISSFTYDRFDYFASQNQVTSLNNDTFSCMLSFLGPKDLDRAEKVCHYWFQFIYSTGQWKRQCQIQFGISTKTDPQKYLPNPSYKKSLQWIFSNIFTDPQKYLPNPSYKKSLQWIFSNIFDESVYEVYLGKVELVPRIPEEISLKKWNDPDPCDPTKTIGREYVWIYCPSYIETTHLEGFYLSKPDDPNDLEAPMLVRETGFETSKNTVLRIPITINNLVELFKHPKKGNPSTCDYIWDKISEQHGNKRIAAGWICMRKNLIGRNLPFIQQKMLANVKGVIITSLLHRILFNFLEHIRSDKEAFYPDGKCPFTFARTSTITRDGPRNDGLRNDGQGNDWPSTCGAGCQSGLRVTSNHVIGDENIGVSVALPMGPVSGS